MSGDDDKALVKVMKDAVMCGTGFMKDGEHIPFADVYLDPRDATIEAQAAEMIEQARIIGMGAERELALRAEIERLREAVQKLSDHACHDDDCQHGVWSDPTPCTCGYEDAWRAVSAALGETE